MKSTTVSKPKFQTLVGQTVRIAAKGVIQHKKILKEVWEGTIRHYKVYVLETDKTVIVDATTWDRLFLKSVDMKPDFKAKQSYTTGNQIANPFRNK